MTEKPMYAAVRFFDDTTLKVHIIPVEKIIEFDKENYSTQPFFVLRYCDALEEEEYVPAQVLAVHDDPEKFKNQSKRYHFHKMRLSEAATILAEKQILKNAVKDKENSVEDSDKTKDVGLDQSAKICNIKKEKDKNEQSGKNKSKTNRKNRTKNEKKNNTTNPTLKEIIDNKMKTMTQIDLTYDEPSNEVEDLKKEIEELQEKNTALNITAKYGIQENLVLKNELRLKNERINVLETKIKEMEEAKNVCAPSMSGSTNDLHWEENELYDQCIPTSSNVIAEKRTVSEDSDSDTTDDKKSIKKLKLSRTDKKKANEDSESYDSEDYKKENDQPMENYKSWLDSSKHGLKMCHLRYGISIPYKSWVTIRDAKTSSIFVRKLAGTLWSKK